MKNNFQIFQEVILSKSLLPISQMKKSDAKESSFNMNDTKNFFADKFEKKSMKSTAGALSCIENSHYISRKKSVFTTKTTEKNMKKENSSKSLYIFKRNVFDRMMLKSQSERFEEILDGLSKLNKIENSLKKTSLE